MTRWFGQSWGAPVCAPNDHIGTPAGEACAYCKGTILTTDRGVMLADGTTYHLACFMRSLGLDGFPPGYGWNYHKPIVKVRWADLTLDDPSEEGSMFRVRCPVCNKGVLRVQRKPPTFALNRRDFCSKCVQRFEYTDDTINGEGFAP